MSSTDDGDPYSHTYFEPPKTFVKSAVRVLNVLEYFYRDRQPARAVEISRELDLPVSSTKYLLTSLVETGYLTFDKKSKKYFPSILFTGFASWLAGIYPSGEVLRALAKEVHDAFGEVTSITVQHEDHMRALVIETDSTTIPPAYDFRVRIPLLGSASGSIALAANSDEEVAALISRESRKLSPDLRQQYNDLAEQIRTAREQGYAVKPHAVTMDDMPAIHLAIAIPVPVANNSPPMALGIMGPRDRLGGREAEIVRDMQTIVERRRPALGLY